MSRYNGPFPMEWEYQNGVGRIDPGSPFAQVSGNSQRFPPSQAKKSEPGEKLFHLGHELTRRTQGTYDVFEFSPPKSRNMGSQQSSPKKSSSQPAAWNTHFNTPRQPSRDLDDSSAGETPRSPERQNDSDATPDDSSALILMDDTQTGAARDRGSPTKERPNAYRTDSLFRKLTDHVKNKVNSPGRGAMTRSSGAIDKVARRRLKEVDRTVAKKRRHSMSDSSEEQDQPPQSPRKSSREKPNGLENKPHWVSSTFTFIAQHPTLPNTLSQYAQFIFNLFWLSILGYAIYCFWSAVQGDVDKMSGEAMADVMADISKCAEEYRVNKCEPETRLRGLEKACEEWAKCMSRDPRKVGRANISARTFAQIFNSFVEPISYKAMIFTCVLVFGCFAISNFVSLKYAPGRRMNTDCFQAFGFFRHRMQQEYQPMYAYGPPAPTPQRSFSGQDGAFYAGTPWHQPPPGAGFEPQPSGGFGQIDGRGSPQRRLVYN